VRGSGLGLAIEGSLWWLTTVESRVVSDREARPFPRTALAGRVAASRAMIRIVASSAAISVLAGCAAFSTLGALSSVVPSAPRTANRAKSIELIAYTRESRRFSRGAATRMKRSTSCFPDRGAMAGPARVAAALPEPGVQRRHPSCGLLDSSRARKLPIAAGPMQQLPDCSRPDQRRLREQRRTAST